MTLILWSGCGSEPLSNDNHPNNSNVSPNDNLDLNNNINDNTDSLNGNDNSDLPPDNDNQDMPDNDNDASSNDNNSNDNEQPPDGTELAVWLGNDRSVTAEQAVSISATLFNTPENSQHYYLWTITEIETGDTTQPQSANDYFENLDTIQFVLAQLFEGNLAGRNFQVSVDVMIMSSSNTRHAFDSMKLKVLAPGQGGNSNDNGGSSGGGGGSGGNDNENSNENTNDNVDDGSLQVAQSEEVRLCLYQVPYTIMPQVSGGTPSYNYEWTPTTYLSDGHGFLGGAVGFTTSEVDFVPPTTGNYQIALRVEDTLGAVVDKNITLHVFNYNPLIASAGADQVTQASVPITINGVVSGGSCNDGNPTTPDCTYNWSPGAGSSLSFNPPVVQAGETNYTLTVTDNVTGFTSSDTVRVVVLPMDSGSCTGAEWNTGITSGFQVAYDPNYGALGQAIILSGKNLYFFDLAAGVMRNGSPLVLPANGRSLVVDTHPSRRRAFVSTQIVNQYTRSVQVVNLSTDPPSLASNIALTDFISEARGMSVIKNTGKVIITVSGFSDGVMLVDPDNPGTVLALQNMHHTNSFVQPIDVAYLPNYDIAVVANASGSMITLVPISSITFTPDDNTGGGQAALPTISIGNPARAIAAHLLTSEVVVGWHGSTTSYLQVVSITSATTGQAGSYFPLGGFINDLGLDVNSFNDTAYAALGTSGVALIDLAYDTLYDYVDSSNNSVSDVIAEAEHNKLLLVGDGAFLTEECP
ncbi:MAG: hypothetical protein HJJLKODD_02902 [Phycisphaerae bacterium]|nr:hypothetical protein [Phycisphaerae bacterium]